MATSKKAAAKKAAPKKNAPPKASAQPKQAAPPSLKSKYEAVRDLLEKYKGSISQALPPGIISADRFIRVCLTAISKDTRLLDCTPYTLMGAVLTAAQFGLLPEAQVLGQCYFSPKVRYAGTKMARWECELMFGYRGLCELAMRSGLVLDIKYKVVFEGDEFDYNFGIEEKLYHKPKHQTIDPDKIEYFYSYIKLKGGGILFDVMPKEEMDAVRDECDNYKFATDKTATMWHRYYPDMGKKTVLRRNLKLAPLTPDIARAIGLDEAADIGLNQNMKLEVLEDLATEAEMKEAVYADIQQDVDAKAEHDKGVKIAKGKEKVGLGVEETLKNINSRRKK